jgi:hypothetical protein
MCHLVAFTERPLLGLVHSVLMLVRFINGHALDLEISSLASSVDKTTRC